MVVVWWWHSVRGTRSLLCIVIVVFLLLYAMVKLCVLTLFMQCIVAFSVVNYFAVVLIICAPF